MKKKTPCAIGFICGSQFSSQSSNLISLLLLPYFQPLSYYLGYVEAFAAAATQALQRERRKER